MCFSMLAAGFFVVASLAQAQVRMFEVPASITKSPRIEMVTIAANGKVVAGVCAHQVLLWDTASGKYLTKLPLDQIHGIDVTPDGKQLVVSGSQGVNASYITGLFVYDAATGLEVRRNLNDDYLGYPLVSPNGKWVITVGDRLGSGGIGVYRLDAPKQKRQTMTFENPSFTQFAFSRDGNHLSLAQRRMGTAGAISLFDMETGETKASTKNRYDAASSLAFHPDGKTLLASVRKNNESHLVALDAVTLKEVKRLEDEENFRSSDRYDSHLAISPDGKWIAESSHSLQRLQLWDLDAGKVRGTLSGSYFRSFRFTPDSKWVLSGNVKVLLWDIASHTRTLKPDHVVKAHPRAVQGLAIDPSGKTVASADHYSLILRERSKPDAARVLVDGKSRLGPPGFSEPCAFRSVQFSATGLLAFTALNSKNDYSVHVLDLEKNAYVFASESMQFTPTWARFTPNGKRLFVHVNPGFDPAWKEAIGKPGIIAFDAGNWKFAGPVADFKSSEQNSRLFSMFSDESKFVFSDAIFDLKTKKWKSLDRDFRSHGALVVTRDGTKMLGGYHNRIRLYDLEDEELTQPCILDNETINDIALTTDERYFATACHDKTVRIWTFPKCDLVATLPHTDPVERVAWTPDGKNLVSGDEKGQLWFWTLP